MLCQRTRKPEPVVHAVQRIPDDLVRRIASIIHIIHLLSVLGSVKNYLFFIVLNPLKP